MFPKNLLFALLIFPFCVFAQVTFPVNGVHDDRNGITAFVHMTLVVQPGVEIDSAVLLVQDGWIIDAGRGLKIPEYASVVDLSGTTVYPSFIELVTNIGIAAKPKTEHERGPQLDNKILTATNWNQAVTPEFEAYTIFVPDTAANRRMREIGFGAALTHRSDGIIRGSGAVIDFGDERANDMLLQPNASRHFSFSKGSSTQDYPSSQMGSIALLRQSFYDADWYRKGGYKEELNLSLQAMNDQSALPAFFHVTDKLEILRVAAIGKEFGIRFTVEGNGTEYQRANEIRETGLNLILPLQFPAVPEVKDVWDSYHITLSTLKHWELAPANPGIMEQTGVQFALTSNGLDSKKDFLPMLRKAVAYGLSDSTALAALTTVPAQMAGVSKVLGTLEKGKKANFLVMSGNLFHKETIIYENWINGQPYYINNRQPSDIRGVYSLKANNTVYGLLVQGTADRPEFSIVKGSDTLSAKGKYAGYNISLTFEDGRDLYRLSGSISNRQMHGSGQFNEQWITWSASFGNVYAEKTTEQKQDTIQLGEITYPFLPFGWTEQPKQETILITNATVWTNEAEGILEQTDVLISRGKVQAVGKNLTAKDARIIDGTGKHVTCGIIDEHSHIAISDGVNEGTQSITSEVRIGDVVDSEDINIYRQLAGGVTTSQLLHGSANAIGGQAALIKLRWGSAPEQMKLEGADGFIKFALGENVKQSNWGDMNRVRYPQTRMGVEQIMEDGFTRAEAYIAAKKDPAQLVRIDLELEALAEILQGKRFITCHSYVQSEINMLMKLAERHQFRVNTFTHILEGYKVADKMETHGAGASTFSDWWAYKYEVVEAIPYNAALLTLSGVVTAINSDDAEMARRLNQEAAKAVKYGGLTEEEAWKLVTLNPAKLLHIDHRVGSIKQGKDADIVIWSAAPLSIYAVAEKTFVDGRLYYDREADARLQQEIEAEKLRLLRQIAQAEKNGEKVAPVVQYTKPEYHCETVGDFTSGK
jgi:imidazolonepropionase-like amidohydrolase